MGLSIYYSSTDTLTVEEADAIRSAAVRANAGRSWLGSEPVTFFPGLQDRKLVGGSKPNFSPHPDDRDAAAKSGLPDGTATDVVTILSRLSVAHAVDWELTHDFGKLGFIRAGTADASVVSQVEAFADLGDAFGEFDGDEFA